MSTPDEILDEFVRIMATLDQIQTDIDNVRRQYEGIESVQCQLDERQISLDSTRSKVKIGIQRGKRIFK